MTSLDYKEFCILFKSLDEIINFKWGREIELEANILCIYIFVKLR